MLRGGDAGGGDAKSIEGRRDGEGGDGRVGGLGGGGGGGARKKIDLTVASISSGPILRHGG